MRTGALLGNRFLLGVAAILSVAISSPAFAAHGIPLQPVGLDARGMDPWIVVRHAHSLDVRDADNRPVSSLLIERQMKAAMTSGAAQVSFTASLPRIQAVLESLERLVYRALSWTGRAPRLPLRVVQAAAPVSRSSDRFLLSHAFSSTVPEPYKLAFRFGCGAPPHPAGKIPLVLRC